VDADLVAVDGQKKPVRKMKSKRTMDIAILRRAYEQAKAVRGPVEGVWQELARFFAPLGSGENPGVKLDEGSARQQGDPNVWDSTAIDSSQKLAASIHGSVTNPAIRWFKLAWRLPELKDDPAEAAWLDQVADIVFDALQDSDFNTEIASADQDLVTLGNCFVVEEAKIEAGEWKGVDFTAVPLREGFVEEDSAGGVFRFFRRNSWTGVQVLDKFREECPEEIRQKVAKAEDVEKRYEIVFAVWCRPERLGKRIMYPSAPHLRPVGYAYFNGETGEAIGEEGGYYEMPVCFARWAKSSGSVYGHGQCNIMLPTVKYLNGWMETEHQAAAKNVDPALAVTERGLLSDLDLEPGGVTVVREKDSISVIESKGNANWANMKLEELRGMVRRALFDDQLSLKDSPAMTATEVTARYELMNRILGSTLARIETDLLSPIVSITIGQLMRAGRLPKMPPKAAKLYRSGKAAFNIEYQGPLARSQRTDEVAAIERVLAFAAALLKMGVPMQIVMATIDVVKAIREVANRLGTPANLLKPDAEVERAIAQFQADQARAVAAETSRTESEAVRNQAQARAAMGAQGPVPALPPPLVAPAFPPTAAPAGAMAM
jgi:hypothetical protein